MKRRYVFSFLLLQFCVILLMIIVTFQLIKNYEKKCSEYEATNVKLNFHFDEHNEFEHSFIHVYVKNQKISQIENGEKERINVSLSDKNNTILLQSSEDCRGVELIEINVDPNIENEYDINLSLYNKRIILYECIHV